MKVLFVCTGNICRSPMGELMFPLFFHDDSIVTDSAGVQGLLNSPIDPASALLLAQDGIDSRAFRSKRLTPQLAMSNDLILCFTEHQRRKIVALAPRVRTKTFTLNGFAALCAYCADHNIVQGNTVDERSLSVLRNAPMVQPVLGNAPDIADPYRKEIEIFQDAHDAIGEAIAQIASALAPSQARHAS